MEAKQTQTLQNANDETIANLSQNLALAMESLFELESKMEGIEAKESELAEAKLEAEQAKELADAQKMIFEQKLKIMELEQIEQKSAMHSKHGVLIGKCEN